MVVFHEGVLMAYLFNFDRHLNKIIGHQLKQYGFIRKGTRFYRFVGKRFKETIYFQPSRGNSRCCLWMNKYYINLFLMRDGEEILGMRIPNVPVEFFDKKTDIHRDNSTWEFKNEEDLEESLKSTYGTLDGGLKFFQEIEKKLRKSKEITRKVWDRIYNTSFFS
jgi:hypothetical protein